MSSKSTTETALGKLQTIVRQPSPPGERAVRQRNVPDDLATDAIKGLGLDRQEHEAFEKAKAVVLTELRFEHLDDKEVDKAVWRFTCQAALNRKTDHVPAFVNEHARPVRKTTCFIPVEYLKVIEKHDVGDVRLLPTDAAEVPEAQHWFKLDPPVGCVAAVAVSGTNYKLMADRGRESAEHAIRCLRVAMRAHHLIQHRQLRFQLGESYAFSENLTGWATGPGTAWDITYTGDIVEVATTQPVFSLSSKPRNHFERKANLALKWIDRGMMATEPVVALLYYFFALEALLGDTSAKLKAPMLAQRRAMLATAVGEGFKHPTETYFLYEQVRSAAVHGSDAPDISEDLAHEVGFDVRRALKQYLQFGGVQNFTKQSQLVMALDEHPQHPELIEWLRQNGGPVWIDYIDSLSDRSLARLSRKPR
jgi:hypothetical protein